MLTGWEHPLIPMIVALVSSRSAMSHPRNYLDRHIVIPAPSVRHMKLAGVNYLSCRAEKKKDSALYDNCYYFPFILGPGLRALLGSSINDQNNDKKPIIFISYLQQREIRLP